MKMKAKALSSIIATILLVVIAVVLVSVILSFGQGFTTKGLDKTKDVKELSKSDAEHLFILRPFQMALFNLVILPQAILEI